MSESRTKKDIAQFFKSRPSVIPRKRATPEPNGDVIVVKTGRVSPSSLAKGKSGSYRGDVGGGKDMTSASKPIPTTPKLYRSVSIPIRSPATSSTSKQVQHQPVSALKLTQNKPVTVTKPNAPFVFASAPHASVKRPVTKLQEIADSDDEDDALPSLSAVFTTRNIPKSTLPVTPKKDNDKRSETFKSGSMFANSAHVARIRRQNEIVEAERREQTASRDFALLMQDEQDDKTTQNLMAEAEEQREKAARVNEASNQNLLDRETVLHFMQGGDAQEMDTEEKNRLLKAVNRTGALPTELIFSFFAWSGPNSILTRKPSKMPQQLAVLCTSNSRASYERLFRSGFVMDLAAQGHLDDISIRWIFDSILTEANGSMRRHYIDIIDSVSSNWTWQKVSAEDIQGMFSMIGAETVSLDSTADIKAKTNRILDNRPHDYQHLMVLLKLIDSICQNLDFPALTKLCSILLRLSADERAMRHNIVCQLTEGIFDKLLSIEDATIRQHVSDRISEELMQRLHSPQLQILVLSHLPYSSPNTATLRSTLAYSFLCQSTTASSPGHGEHPSFKEIIATVRAHPSFSRQNLKSSASHPSTYPDLQARTRILGIAISDGFRPTVFDTRNEENDFDAEVDELADHINQVFVSISDGGPINLPRAEAKQALSMLENRLRYDVRTKPKRKRHTFDPIPPSPGRRKHQTKSKVALDLGRGHGASELMTRYFKPPIKEAPSMSTEHG